MPAYCLYHSNDNARYLFLYIPPKRSSLNRPSWMPICRYHIRREPSSRSRSISGERQNTATFPIGASPCSRRSSSLRSTMTFSKRLAHRKQSHIKQEHSAHRIREPLSQRVTPIAQRTVFIISAFTRAMCSGRTSPSAFMPLRTIVSARESLIHFCIGDERRCPYVSLWSSGDIFDRVNDLVCNRSIHCPTAIIVITITTDIANKPCQLIKSRGIPPRGTCLQPLANQVNLMLILV